jgi:hypothetical protein
MDLSKVSIDSPHLIKANNAYVLETAKGGELYYHLKMSGKFSVETSRALIK